MANNIFKYNGYNIGNSLYELNLDNLIKNIFLFANHNNCKIHIPIDIKVGKNFNGNSTEKEFKDI